MQNTQIIKPHCVSEVRARKCVLSANTTEAIGRIRKAYTGMRTAKKPIPATQIKPYSHRQRDKETQKQRAIIGSAGRNQRDELAESGQRNEREKYDEHTFARQ